MEESITKQMSCISFGETQANVQVGKLDTTEVPKAIDSERIGNDRIEAFLCLVALHPNFLALVAATPIRLLFGTLLSELQVKIWNIAAREVPRLVEITARGNFQGHTPALLGVSLMARELALEVYDALRPRSRQPVYFNPGNDTLVFSIVTFANPFPHGYPSFGIIGSHPTPSNFDLGEILASKGIKSFAFKIDGQILSRIPRLRLHSVAMSTERINLSGV
ncbi:hypothetical protein BOTCAL_0277g00160 [Botryotinia calthae]|uniref:2EXR domain-containing protein n=1 Tax=Botryotinia calthae TaxID=38488 RepID=A0A4Y8CW26_9HELO|nr:hypothetical protein BOTCAL_0277g00160 [Botryotinia calthae]